MKKVSRFLIALTGVLVWTIPNLASAQSNRASSDGKQRTNQNVIGLAAGYLEGAPLRLAAELGRALDDGDNMRVMPIVTRGIFENFTDLLHLRGVDAAIIYADTLDYYETVEKIPHVADHVRYIANLFPSEMQILARPEIKSIADLAGKKVNFNTKGTAAAFTGPIVFDKLGIKVEATFDPHPKAMKEMRTSDAYAAVVFVTTKPAAPLVQDWPAGFKLLSVPYARELEDAYLPATLDARDFPKLIKDGEKIETISVPAILAVYNWEPGSEHYPRMSRFVDYVFDRLPLLQKEPNHPAWRDVNLASPVPGWKRFGPAERKLEKLGLIKKQAKP